MEATASDTFNEQSSKRFLTVLDSIDPHAFHGLQFDGLAGYSDGSWPDYSEECRLYPDLAKKHHIFAYAASVHDDATGADCELGDMSVSELIQIWLPRQLKRGVWRPVVYANLDRWNNQGLRSGLDHLGNKIRRVVAWYTYKPGIEPAIINWADGQQWSDRYMGRNIDANSMKTNFFGESQPAHHNNPHYDMFLNVRWRTPWGNLSERGVVERYDEVRKHGDIKDNHEVHQCAAQLAWFSKRVNCQAVYGDPGHDGKPDWKKDDRGFRYVQMGRRSHGVKFV